MASFPFLTLCDEVKIIKSVVIAFREMFPFKFIENIIGCSLSPEIEFGTPEGVFYSNSLDIDKFHLSFRTAGDGGVG